MDNFIEDGDTLTLPAPADVTAGEATLIGTIFGVAVDDASSGDDCVFKLKGVYSLPKTSSQAWTVGLDLYWDASNKKVTSTATSNHLIGTARDAAASADTVGNVRLNGSIQFTGASS